MTAPETDVPLSDDDNELSAAERLLLQAVSTGTVADVRIGEPESDDPAGGAVWDADRTVRAELLTELLTAERGAQGGLLRAVKLRGARVVGVLDLEAAELRRPLLLADCHIDEPVNLSEATAPAIRLPGCLVPSLAADRLRTIGNLELNRGFAAYGEVRLAGAHIGGLISLDAARLINPGGRALVGNGLSARSIVCRDGFTAEGELRLIGARVDGVFDLDGARLVNPGGRALDAVRLSVAGDLHCRHGFVASGEIQLSGAGIGGELCFDGARLTNPGGRALTAERLVVEQDVLCREGFTAEGEVRLQRSHIAGFLDLDGARLDNAGATALSADGLTVDQGMLCRDGFTARGAVRLVDARIGYLDLSSAMLTNPGGPALLALRLNVRHNMFCRYGFTAEGGIRLVGARIGDRLSFIGARLINPDDLALDLERASADTLILRPRQPPEGGVDLTNTQVRAFSDDPASWPATMLLWGFTYEILESDEADVRARLRWLTHSKGPVYSSRYYDQLTAAYGHGGLEAVVTHAGSIKERMAARDVAGYSPEIYDQLAAAYRRAGRDEAARRVAIAKQWRRRKALGPAGKLLNWLLYLTVGYGYRTWLAAGWLAGLLACGTWIFDRAYPAGLVRAEDHGPAFHALAYTLDVLLPIVDLGQQDAWQPHGATMYWSWAFMGAGWVLTTAVAAGLTGLTRWARS
jgi:hypothetical protein